MTPPRAAAPQFCFHLLIPIFRFWRICGCRRLCGCLERRAGACVVIVVDGGGARVLLLVASSSGSGLVSLGAWVESASCRQWLGWCGAWLLCRRWLGVCRAVKGMVGLMSKVRCALGLVLSAGLAVLALGGLGVSFASAATALPPDIKVCKQLPVGSLIGLWESAECGGSYVAAGKYAWSWADGGGTATIYCVLKQSGGFADNLCEKEQSGGPFGELLIKEPFPKLLGLQLLSVLKGKLFTETTGIHCEHGRLVGQPATAKEIRETVVTYTGCIVEKPTGCQISNPGALTLGELETKSLLATEETLTLVGFVPESGTAFIEIEYHGSACGSGGVLNGKSSFISGSQKCEWEAGSGHPLIIHLLFCHASGSKLKFGGEAQTYEGGVHVHFEGEPYWKIQ